MNVEAIAGIFTIIDGKFKVLLFRRKTEPYKGYWVLPNEIIDKNKTLEETIEEYISSNVGLSNLEYEQVKTFTSVDRNPSKRIIGISCVSIIDSRTIELNHVEETDTMEWFEIDGLPKIGYDHQEIIDACVEVLKDKLMHSFTLKKLFPSDFTFPEIQKMYEQVLGVELDRRNFRKKFMSADLVEETGDKTSSLNGRPAKLYRFKDNIENILLF